MTTTEPTLIHFIESLLVHLGSDSVFGAARVMQFGDELEVTPQVIDANRDRFGHSWLEAWLSTDEDEYRRGDKLIARRGAWPAGTCPLLPGSFEWADARENAIREAFAITDPAARAERRREVEAYFGPAPSTSRTHATISGGATR